MLDSARVRRPPGSACPSRGKPRARHNIAVSYMLKFPLSQKLFRLLAHDQSIGPVELNRRESRACDPEQARDFQRETLRLTKITCRC